MRVVDSVIAMLLSGVLLACATPPPPEGSNSSGLALLLNARSLVSIFPARVEQVLFVRLDESRDDPILGTSVFYSNYSDDGYFYLLNPPPGKYVAVAAVTTTTPYVPEAPAPEFGKDGKLNTDTPPGHRPWGSPAPGSFDQAIYFDEDFVRQTEVTARPRSLSFMGEFVVHTSALRSPDTLQAHYYRLLQPGESNNIIVQLVYRGTGIYSGHAAATEQGDAARDRFLHKASEHLMSAGWREMLKGAGGGPAQ